MAALSDTQLPVYFNGRYCRVCVTIVSSTTSFSSCSWNSIVPKGQESAVSVVCSVLLPALVGALSKSRCLTTTTRKKIRRSYDDMAGWKDWLSSSSSVSSFAERWRGEKKVKRVDLTRRNPSWTIAASYWLIFTMELSALNLILNFA